METKKNLLFGEGTMGDLKETPTPPVTYKLWDLILIYYFIFCFISGGSLNVLVFIRQMKRMLSRPTRSLYLRVHLNLSDLLVLLIYVPSMIGWHLTIDWRGGLVMCKLLKVLHELSFLISSAILACIGLDRLLSIIQPFVDGAVAERRAKIMSLIAWTYSILFSSKNLFMWTLNPIRNDTAVQCTSWFAVWSLQNSTTEASERLQNWIYMVHLVTVFFLPLLIMSICYTVIVVHVWRHYQGDTSRRCSCGRRPERKSSGAKSSPFRRALEAIWSSSRRHRSLTEENDVVVFIPGTDAEKEMVLLQKCQCSRNGGTTSTPLQGNSPVPQRGPRSPRGRCFRSSNQNAERVLRLRTLITTLILITAYIVCWLPYQLTTFWYYLDPVNFKLNRQMFRMLSLIITLNSVINPFIYGIPRGEIKAFLRKWCPKCCCAR